MDFSEHGLRFPVFLWLISTDRNTCSPVETVDSLFDILSQT